MNPDLKLRLKKFAKLKVRELTFLSRFIERLRNETDVRTVVYFEAIQGDEDDTGYVLIDAHGNFTVVIDERLSFGTACDYLIHEFAHVGTWSNDEANDHGPLWGAEYARLYCIYLEVYIGWFG